MVLSIVCGSASLTPLCSSIMVPAEQVVVLKKRTKVVRKIERIEYIHKVTEKLRKMMLFPLESIQLQGDITELRSCWRLEVQLRTMFALFLHSPPGI